MAGKNRVGGLIALKIDGDLVKAKGNFTYNLGAPKRDAVIGADTVHGYKEVVQVPFIEGELTDHRGMSLEALIYGEDKTITLELANGKVIVLREAWFAGEGTGNTEEGNIAIRFEGLSAEEIR